MNENHPLVKAMNEKRGPSTSGPTPFDIGPKRNIEIRHEELKGLGGVPVGSRITATVHGVVQSQHSAGHAVVEISKIKPDSSVVENKENPDAESPKGNPVVESQDSASR